MLQWTYNSNAIEGNTLTYKETSFYLLRGLTAKGKSLEEHLEISNHKEAISFLEEIVHDKSLVITEKLIRELHLILFKGIKDIKIGFPGQQVSIPIIPGSYKSQDNHVLKADGSIHFYVPAVAVAAEMKRLVLAIKKKWSNTHPIELAAFAHYELVLPIKPSIAIK
jgi:Fic family protein